MDIFCQAVSKIAHMVYDDSRFRVPENAITFKWRYHMKRFNFIYGLIVMMLFYAANAYAGVWGSIKGVFVENAVTVIISGVVAIVGMFWGGAKLWGKFVKESADVIMTTKDALKENSPGGRKLTAEEVAAIAKESKEAVEAGIEAYASTRKKKTS
jgi:hypothetical protein